MSTATNNVVEVDFTQGKDIDEALADLLRMRNEGRIAGFLFVIKEFGKHRPSFGSAGCCSSDGVAAVGAASMLLHALKTRAMNQ